MASAPSSSPQSFTPRNENQSSLHNDPFWQATPRTNNSIAALMSAVQQVVPPITPPAPAVTAAAPRIRRPQCTHVTMTRAYGQFACAFCGRIPEMGWVYACKQDDLPGQHDPLPDVDVNPVVVPDDCDYFEAKARIAEYLGMSISVVASIRAGRYDVDQIDKLIAQREKLIRVIKAKEQEMASQPYAGASPSAVQAPNIIATVGSAPAQRPANNNVPIPPVGTPSGTLSASTLTNATKQDSQPGRPGMGCNFTFCHTCRPFFVDRTYASFESVLSGKFADLSPSEVARLPIMNPNIALRMGLPKPPASPARITRSQPSMDLNSQYIDDADDEISVDWTQTTTNNDSESVSDTLDSSELYPCPGPGQCPVWSRHSGCAYDAGFDDGRRATNHGFLAEHEARRLTPDTSASELHQILSSTPGASSTASSVSLPTTPTASLLPPMLPSGDTFDVALQKRLGLIGKAHSIGGEYSPNKSRTTLRYKDSKSSMGSEVEVEGGVALTEEAVETHTPDIVTAN